MNRLRIMRCLLGLVVSSALLLAPLAGHAWSGEKEEAGPMAFLSVTCLDLGSDSSDEAESVRQASACHVCPAGCFGGCALACDASGIDGISWHRLAHQILQDQGQWVLVADFRKARSPPVG